MDGELYIFIILFPVFALIVALFSYGSWKERKEKEKRLEERIRKLEEEKKELKAT